MPKVGVTGHVHLAAGTSPLVYRGIVRALRPYAREGLHGVTCLAGGADQLFARAVVALHGTFDAVLPAADYRRKLEPPDRPAFDDLLGRAETVTWMPFDRSGPKSYLAASEEMLNRVEQVVAVWDGLPSDRLGGTAHVVRLARGRGLPVTVVWPAGAHRAELITAASA